MEPLTLSVDLDGTLADFLTPALQSLNDRFGTTYAPEQVTVLPYQSELPALHRAHFEEFVSDVEIYGHLPALPNSIEAILNLASLGYNIVITSHRPPDALRPTRDWLLLHGVPYAQLEVDFGSKAILAERYGPSHPLIFLDDDPSLIQELHLPREGIELWLLQTPYTGPVDLNACRLFSDWSQLQSALSERLVVDTPEI
jgi:uncharacterized HAD superfamily protein